MTGFKPSTLLPTLKNWSTLVPGLPRPAEFSRIALQSRRLERAVVSRNLPPVGLLNRKHLAAKRRGDKEESMTNANKRAEGNPWAGRIFTGVAALMTLASGIAKLAGAPIMVSGLIQAGFPRTSITPIAILELTCTVL